MVLLLHALLQGPAPTVDAVELPEELQKLVHALSYTIAFNT